MWSDVLLFNTNMCRLFFVVQYLITVSLTHLHEIIVTAVTFLLHLLCLFSPDISIDKLYISTEGFGRDCRCLICISKV